MRKINEAMVKAVKEQKNVGIGNTTIIDGAVYLHRNKIACYDAVNKTLILDACGWHTVTTRARIDALCEALGTGYRASIKNGVLGLDNIATGKRVALPTTISTTV